MKPQITQMAQIRKLLVVTVAGALLVGFAYYSCCWPRRSTEIIERLMARQGTLLVRVTSYRETGTFLAGTYFVFEAAADSGAFREFMVNRTDDDADLPMNQVRFLSEQTAYAYMGQRYSVTTDGAKTWSHWDAGKDTPQQLCCRGSILSLHVDADGRGVLKLKFATSQPGQEPEMVTSDFGRHWQPRR